MGIWDNSGKRSDYKRWLIDIKAKSKSQGDTDDSRTLMEKRKSMSSKNIAVFTLTAGKGDVPNHIIQTIISQWSLKVHFHRESPEAKKKMNIKC